MPLKIFSLYLSSLTFIPVFLYFWKETHQIFVLNSCQYSSFFYQLHRKTGFDIEQKKIWSFLQVALSLVSGSQYSYMLELTLVNLWVELNMKIALFVNALVFRTNFF